MLENIRIFLRGYCLVISDGDLTIYETDMNGFLTDHVADISAIMQEISDGGYIVNYEVPMI